MRLVIEYLFGFGYVIVYYVVGLDGWLEVVDCVVGWRVALHDVGAFVLLLFVGDWSACFGYAAGWQLGDVMAVFAVND